MSPISIVIITKNEAANIVDCINAAINLSSDIIVVDTGSSDSTVLFAKEANATVKTISWNGYGDARNAGATLAKNNWIFALDADERITNDLVKAITTLHFDDLHTVYGFKRSNYYGSNEIKYGASAHDCVYRLYNKMCNEWDLALVHEKLVGKGIKKELINGVLTHFSITTKPLLIQKKLHYANLCAHKYLKEKKRFTFIKMIVSPVFNFIKGYIFQLGFLDVHHGFILAKTNALYTYKKYQQLLLLQRAEAKYQKKMQAFLHHCLRNIL